MERNGLISGFVGQPILGICAVEPPYRFFWISETKPSLGKRRTHLQWISECPPAPIHVHLEPQNLTSFGNQVFADGIKGRILMRSSWIRMSSKRNDSVLIRDRKGHSDTEKAVLRSTKAETQPRNAWATRSWKRQ